MAQVARLQQLAVNEAREQLVGELRAASRNAAWLAANETALSKLERSPRALVQLLRAAAHVRWATTNLHDTGQVVLVGA